MTGAQSKAGFTPGPWEEIPTDASVDDNYDPEDGGQRINTWVGVGNPNVRGGMVAIAVDYAAWEDTPRLDANVALIAAAPALYEALERAVATIEDAEKDTNWESGDPYSDEGPIKDFNALLARARGEAR